MDSNNIIKELEKRGFRTDTIADLELSYIKEYKGKNYHYAIVISAIGNVYLINYNKTEENNVINLSDDKDLQQDLIYILENLK